MRRALEYTVSGRPKVFAGEVLMCSVNMIASLPNPDENTVMDEVEREAVGRAQKWITTGIGYALEHGTRPGTIGSVVASNPLAMLAWYVFSLDSGTCGSSSSSSRQTDVWQDRGEDAGMDR